MPRVLVYRIGSLGDTLVSLPALWAVRGHFADDPITLLCDWQVGSRYVLAGDLLHGSGLIDDVLLYPVDRSRRGRWLRPMRMAMLLLRLRLRRFDRLVYLAPSLRTPEQVARDRRFFALAGIRRFIGMEGFAPLPAKRDGEPLATVQREGEMLLERVARSGVPLPARPRMDLNLNAQDQDEVERWRRQAPDDGGRRWIGIGPGSKMPAKIWPAERYERVVRELIERFDVWPVVFGGAEDRAIGDRLLASWGRGANAAGDLSLRASAAAIGRCGLYLGNDTGTMHLAAAASVRCVALFSARAHPGHWSPLGNGHHIFRTTIDCEGCGLEICTARQMECLLRIDPDPVIAACAQILSV